MVENKTVVEGTEQTKITDWKTIPLNQLNYELDEAKDDKKYLLIQDLQGDVATYFRYQGRLTNLSKELVKLQYKTVTQDEVLETLRSDFIKAMRNGEIIVLDLYKEVVDFKTEFTNDAIFPSELVFDYEKWREQDTYL